MEYVFDEDDIKAIRGMKKIHDLNPVLTLEKGVLYDYLSGIPNKNGRYKIGNTGASFLDMAFGVELFINNNEDRVKINTNYRYRGFGDDEDYSTLFNRFYSDAGIERYELFLRIRIISIMVFLHVMPTSRLDVYDGSQKKENLILSATHEHYRRVMFGDNNASRNKYIINSEDFNPIFNYLWYNLNDDITGKDNSIKKISLEENLTVD